MKFQIIIYEISKNQFQNLPFKMQSQSETEINQLKSDLEHESSGNQIPFKILDIKDINELEKIEEISFGGNGKIIKVFKDKTYALKIMNIKTLDIKSFKRFISEYEILNMLDHPNILKTHGIFLSDSTNPPMILLEYCINDMNQAVKEGSLSKVMLVVSIYEIAEGMKYIHHQNIIHRDLKPSNILIAEDGTFKVSDFGISKLVTPDDSSSTVGFGTQKFMAPEIINEQHYDEKVDVYSFGVLVYFILSGGKMPEITLAQVANGKMANIPTSFTPFARDLITKCWNFEPNVRPSFDTILKLMDENNYSLLALSKNETQEIIQKVHNNQERIMPYIK